MLRHLVAVHDASSPEPNLARVAQPLGVHLSLHLRAVSLGGFKQRVALAGALFGQEGIPAHHEPLTWVVGMGDLGQVHLIKERQLDRRRRDERLDLGCPESGDPVHATRRPKRCDPCRGYHAAIPHEADPIEIEAGLCGIDDLCEALGSAVLPAKTSMASGSPCTVAMTPYSIWRSPRFPSREWPKAASSLWLPSTREVVAKKRTLVVQVPCDGSFFDLRFPRDQPVHRLVDLVACDTCYVKVYPEGAALPPRRIGHLGGGLDYLGADERECQVALAARRPEQLLEAELFGKPPTPQRHPRGAASASSPTPPSPARWSLRASARDWQGFGDVPCPPPGSSGVPAWSCTPGRSYLSTVLAATFLLSHVTAFHT